MLNLVGFLFEKITMFPNQDSTNKLPLILCLMSLVGVITYYTHTYFKSPTSASEAKKNDIQIAEELTFEKFHDHGYMVCSDSKGSKRSMEVF